MKRTLLTFILFLPTLTARLGAKDVVWFDGSKAVGYRLATPCGTVVEKALEMFEGDMLAVTGRAAEQREGASVVVCQLDRADNRLLKKLRGAGCPVDSLTGRTDAFWLGASGGRLWAVGGAGRGTAYAVLQLSRMAGVSPWVDWGDVVPEHRDRLSVAEGFETLQRPSVEYRGVFINDEDWSTRCWAPEMGPVYYRRLFQLLLRLRANALWPAMHSGTPAFFSVEGNREVADTFDIAIGTSHCEPLLRNNLAEWDSSQRGDYDFLNNRQQVEDYWRERVRETRGMDALYTLGMRGIHDDPMAGAKTDDEKLVALQQVIDSQRGLLAQELGSDATNAAQVFIPYKEVLEIFDRGLRVPDDVTLMWCDDNYGYLTRQSDSLQQLRQGGAGVYYHLSYWGRPHDYLWLCTTQPGLIFNELTEAYRHQARRMWIINVHDPKVAAYPLSLTMDMAWDIDCVSGSTLQHHLQAWLTEQFGSDAAERLVEPMTEFYRLTAIRRPEFMGWSQVELYGSGYPRSLSPVADTEFSEQAFGNELERYLASYDAIVCQVDSVVALVAPRLADAYYAAVQYPVHQASLMATKQLRAQQARSRAAAGDTLGAVPYAAASMQAWMDIRQQTAWYNQQMAGGKWNHSMSMEPRDLPVFRQPTLPFVPTDEQLEQYGHLQPLPSAIDKDGAIASNACDYSSCEGGVRTVDMLGHSMRAVALEKGAKVSYRFRVETGGEAILHTALIPTQPSDNGDLRYQVSIDDGEPVVHSLREPFRSERWKLNVLQCQARRSQPVTLTEGWHTLTIQALDPHIVLDQWMIDFKKDRAWYVFPLEN